MIEVMLSNQRSLTCTITKFRTFTETCPGEGIVNTQLIFYQVHELTFGKGLLAE